MDIDETPPKATFTSKNYARPGGNTKTQADPHDEHYLHVTRTTSPRPVHGNSHIQTQVSLDNDSAPRVVLDMTETRLTPEPGYSNYPMHLPISGEFESPQEKPLTSSTMNFD